MRHLRHLRPDLSKCPIVANGEVTDDLHIVRNFSVGKGPQFAESKADGNLRNGGHFCETKAKDHRILLQ